MQEKDEKSGSGIDPLDQADFVLDDHQSDDLAKMLAEPPAPTQRLKDLMDRKAPWDD